jgi:hypothetical protein
MAQGKPAAIEMLEMAMGMWVSQALAAAAELGVADRLAGGAKTAAELAKELRVDEGALYRLLRMLASRGVFREVTAKKFELTPLAETLREGVPGSVRHAVMMFNRPWSSRSHEEMVYCVKTGKPSFEKVFGMDTWAWFAQHPAEQENFNRSMTDISAGRQVSAVETYDWRGISSLIDVGGGHGRLLAMVLKKNPGMRGAVFDQPHVVKGAEAVLREAGVADRARTIGGNFFESVPAGSEGGGFDTVMMSHIIHDWDDAKGLAIMKNCRKAVKTGAKLLLLENVLRPGNEPDLGKIIDLEMLVVVGGKERSEEEFAGLMRASGWMLTRVVPTPAGLSVVEGAAV